MKLDVWLYQFIKKRPKLLPLPEHGYVIPENDYVVIAYTNWKWRVIATLLASKKYGGWQQTVTEAINISNWLHTCVLLTRNVSYNELTNRITRWWEEVAQRQHGGGIDFSLMEFEAMVIGGSTPKGQQICLLVYFPCSCPEFERIQTISFVLW